MSLSKKTRILCVNHTGLVSGAERVLLEILRGLDRDKFEAVVTCPVQGGLADEVAKLEVEWFPLPAVRARFSWRPDRTIQACSGLFKTATALRRKVAMTAPAIIHANSVRAGIVATLAAAGTGTPVIWHVHDTLPSHPLSSAIRAIAFAARNTRIIAVSRSAAKHFQGRFPMSKKICTIHNGVDLSRFPVKQPTDSVFRKSIGLSEEDFLVCAIGQVCARKGLLELVEALASIQHEAPRIHLAIVGKVVFPHEGAYLEILHAAATRLNLIERVHFTGEISNVSAVLRAADLLVLNSRDEPFGLVLIEAMASGTPVLATRVGGIPEIVTDGENGWLVEKADTPALASKLLELSGGEDQLAQVARRALLTAHSRFSVKRLQQELEQFYTKLASSANRNWSARNRPALLRSTNN
jgi:L-malate glycosyltransferase